MSTGHDQLVYRVSLNTSLVYSDNHGEREATFNLMKEMYGLRSKAVNGDIPSFVKAMGKADIYDKFFFKRNNAYSLIEKTRENNKRYSYPNFKCNL